MASKQHSLHRIAIIGLPGSGKSTFAIQLGRLLSVPVYHLDVHLFDGTTKRDKTEFLSFKENLVNQESWIIEGCSFSTFELRFARADTVIYFQFSRVLCLWRILKRLLSFNQDIADTGCLQGINWPLIKYIWNFDRDKRERIEELRKQFPKVEFIVFPSPKDAAKYLKWLELKRENYFERLNH